MFGKVHNDKRLEVIYIESVNDTHDQGCQEDKASRTRFSDVIRFLKGSLAPVVVFIITF
ncbi:MAG: hypothetical protein KAT58_12665 [candidate division Zixibacteria bacterium]|nr:hypothetical protein [candidate division Zixibacteria bacterium]